MTVRFFLLPALMLPGIFVMPHPYSSSPPAPDTTPPYSTSPSPSPAPGTTPPYSTSPSPSPAPGTTPPYSTSPSPSPAPGSPGPTPACGPTNPECSSGDRFCFLDWVMGCNDGCIVGVMNCTQYNQVCYDDVPHPVTGNERSDCVSECSTTCQGKQSGYSCPATLAALLATGSYCYYPKDGGNFDHYGKCYREVATGGGGGNQCCYSQNSDGVWVDNCSGSYDIIAPYTNSDVATTTNPEEECDVFPDAGCHHCKVDVLPFCAAHCNSLSVAGKTYSDCSGEYNYPRYDCTFGECYGPPNPGPGSWTEDKCNCKVAGFDPCSLDASDFPPVGSPSPFPPIEDQVDDGDYLQCLCGGQGEPCCVNNQCENGQVCIGGTCAPAPVCDPGECYCNMDAPFDRVFRCNLNGQWFTEANCVHWCDDDGDEDCWCHVAPSYSPL